PPRSPLSRCCSGSGATCERPRRLTQHGPRALTTAGGAPMMRSPGRGGFVDRYLRLLFLAFFIASVVWRVIKGLQAGAAARPQRGIPPSGGTPVPSGGTVAPSSPASDPLAGPDADPARLPATAAAVA